MNKLVAALPEELRDVNLRFLDYIEERAKQDTVVFKTGIKILDHVTSGGFAPATQVLLASRPNFGKCLGRGTNIMMYDGTIKAVENIVTGDLVMGADSTPRTVLSTTHGKDMMYLIHQNRAMNYRVNKAHVLSLKSSSNGDILNISVEDIIETKPESFLKNYKGYSGSILSCITITEDCIDDYYGFMLDGDHLFLLEDGTVTHNSACLQTIVRGMIDNDADDNVIVICYSLDDARITFYNRLIASMCHLPIDHIEQESRRTDEDRKIIADKMQLFREYYSKKLLVRDSADIQARLDNMIADVVKVFRTSYEHSGKKPQLVVTLDSARNLDMSYIEGLASNPTAATEFVSRRIKDMLSLQCDGVPIEPIVLMTEHLRKLPTGVKRPGADDIKDSIGVQYDSNLTLMLWNDLCYSRTVTRENSDMQFSYSTPAQNGGAVTYVDPIIELSVDKNKMGRMNFGADSIALFKFYQNQSRLEQLTGEEYKNYARLIRQ